MPSYDINLFGQTYVGVRSVIYNGSTLKKLILNNNEYVFDDIPSYTEGISYAVVSNTYATVSAGTATATSIILRDVYNGCPVTHILANAFLNKTAITSIIFPSGLTTIESQAFYGCTKLVFTELPIGVSSVPVSAFRGCSSLVSVNLKGVTIINGSLLSGAFNSCTSLTNVTIGSYGKAVTSINKYTFRNCTNLTNITVYTANGVSLADAPWGADNATVTYMVA